MPFNRSMQIVVLLMAWVGLSACAQSPKDINDTQPMTQDDPTVAALNEASKAADAAHDAQRAAGAPRAESRVERLDAAAPDLSVAELHARIVRLLVSLQAAEDTEAAHVGEVLGISFSPELLAIHEGEAVGKLTDLGPYRVSVQKLYKSALGKNVDITFRPPTVDGQRSKACTFDLKSFAAELAANGYDGGDTTQPHREQWGFVRHSKAADTTFYVTAEMYRADDGTDAGRLCVTSVLVEAARGKP